MSTNFTGPARRAWEQVLTAEDNVLQPPPGSNDHFHVYKREAYYKFLVRIAPNGVYLVGVMMSDLAANAQWTPDFTVDHVNRTITLTSQNPTEAMQALVNILKSQFQAVKNFAEATPGNTELCLTVCGLNVPFFVDKTTVKVFSMVMSLSYLVCFVSVGGTQIIKVWLRVVGGADATNREAVESYALPVVADVKNGYNDLVCLSLDAQDQAGLDAGMVHGNAKEGAVLRTLHSEAVSNPQGMNDPNQLQGLVQPRVHYVYDIDLRNTEPHATHPRKDGVQFRLVPWEHAAEAVRQGRLPREDSVVLFDFLVRRNLVKPQHNPDVHALRNRLQRSLPFPTGLWCHPDTHRPTGRELIHGNVAN